MTDYIKIGPDIIKVDAITRVSLSENRSGISDRIILEVGGIEVIIDSGLVGKKQMYALHDRFMRMLKPEDWDQADPVLARAA